MSKGIILIVEDQPDLRKLLRVTMSLEDLEIHEAEDGHAALKAAQALAPDVMLLDVMMPGGLDGLQVCERIKSDPMMKKTRIIMLTARAQESDIAAAMAAGADGYLSKPFSPLELIAKVQSLLPTTKASAGAAKSLSP